MSNVAAKVKQIIIDKLGVTEDMVTMDASFTGDLGADSLDTVELIMQFENELGVKIAEDDAQKIQTVGQAVELIEQLQESK